MAFRKPGKLPKYYDTSHKQILMPRTHNLKMSGVQPDASLKRSCSFDPALHDTPRVRARLSRATLFVADRFKIYLSVYTAKIILVFEFNVSQIAKCVYLFSPLILRSDQKRRNDQLLISPSYGMGQSHIRFCLRKRHERKTMEETMLFLSPLWCALRIVHALCIQFCIRNLN